MAGDGKDAVAEKDCEKCRESFQRQIDEVQRVTEKRLDAHAGELSDFSKLLERVVTLQEVQAKTAEVSEQRLRLVEERVVTNDARRKSEGSAKAKSEGGSEKSPFWKEKWFFVLVVTGCILLVLVVGAAIGQNILKEYLEVIKK